MIDGSAAWEKTTFGEQFKVRYGKASPRTDRSPDGPVPVVGSAGQMAYTNSPLVSEPCLVIGRKGNVGQTHLMIDGSWPTDTTYYVLMRDDIDPKFLQYQLISRDLRRLDSSTATPSLRRQDLESVPLTKPRLAEQRRIVEVLEDHLSRLDAADVELHRAQSRSDVVLLAALRAHVESSRSAGIPFRPIGEFASTSLGKMLDAKRTTGEPTPYLANINVRWGHFDLDSLKSVPLTSAERDRLELVAGDLIVCEGGEPGRCAVWDRDGSGIVYQKALHRVRLHDRLQIEPQYVALMLRECIQSGRADRLFTGTTIKHLPQEKLRLIELPLPDHAVQLAALDNLANVANANGRLTASLAGARSRGSALRRAVLAAAFSGKLTGHHTDDERIEELAEAQA